MRKTVLKRILALLLALLCLSALTVLADDDPLYSVELLAGNPEACGQPCVIRFYKVAYIGPHAEVVPLDVYRDVQITAEDGNPLSLAEFTPNITGDDYLQLADAVAAEISDKAPMEDFCVTDFSELGEARADGVPGGLYMMIMDPLTTSTEILTAQPAFVWVPMPIAIINGEYQWKSPVVMEVKMGVEPRFGHLRIIKTLNSSDEIYDEATFVFSVKGELELSAEESTTGFPETVTVLDDVVVLTFSKNGTKSYEIKDLPVGTRITVKEIYTSGYNPVGAVVCGGDDMVIVANDFIEAHFVNDHPTIPHHSNVVKNVFVYKADTDTHYAFKEKIYYKDGVEVGEEQTLVD